VQLVVQSAPMGQAKVQPPPLHVKSHLAPAAQEKTQPPPLHVPVHEEAASQPTTQRPSGQLLPHWVICLQVQFSLTVELLHAPAGPLPPVEVLVLDEEPPSPALDAGTLQSWVQPATKKKAGTTKRRTSPRLARRVPTIADAPFPIESTRTGPRRYLTTGVT
jgi:hypothetical protein